MIVVNKNLSKEYFLSRAGALHGYAKDMFSRIYDSIFSEAERVDDILNKYYSDEYEKIEDFLYSKYCINPSDVDEIMKLVKSNENYVLYDFDELNYGDSGAVTFAFSSDMYERIINILLMR
ncbi:MAG: hypothetical protein NC548_45920 [Lachnospiraceae bacterium]|nr:hypothetical protein [Lachnospiraceae bacterium]